jgi:carboxyl-terminal processing protease
MPEMARRGDTQFADQVHQQYAKRVQEACSYAATFLSVEHDFTVDEEFPREFSAYASGPDQLRERWRLRIKAELLVEKAHGTALSVARTWLAGRYRRIERQAQEMTDERFCGIYLNALAKVYDPHTAYLSPKEVVALTRIMTLSEYTIGLTFRERRGRWVIFGGLPTMADAATLQCLAGWELLALQRPDGTMCDVVEMPAVDFAQLIRSPAGALGNDTEVVLELQNPATFERRTVSWIRLGTFL